MEPLAQVELTRYVKALKILSLGLGHLDKIKKETETTTEKTEKIWEYYSKVFRAIKEDIDVKIPRLYSIQNLDEKLEKIKTEAEYLFHNNSQMILMMQNFGSQPKTNCKTMIEVVITIGFLYFRKIAFILTTVTLSGTANFIFCGFRLCAAAFLSKASGFLCNQNKIFAIKP